MTSNPRQEGGEGEGKRGGGESGTFQNPWPHNNMKIYKVDFLKGKTDARNVPFWG